MSGNAFSRPARAEAARRAPRPGTRVAWGRADEAGLWQVEEAAWIAGCTASSWLHLTLILIHPHPSAALILLFSPSLISQTRPISTGSSCCGAAARGGAMAHVEGVEKLCHGANRNLADPSGAFFRAKSLPLTGILAQLWLFRAIFSLLFCPFSTSRRITPWD